MATRTFDILPPAYREPIDAIAKSLGYDPETVVVGWLAFDEIKKLPKDERAKAVAVVVHLFSLAARR